MQNDHLRERLGERFCHVFHACKHDELLQFERLITETEIEWMLKTPDGRPARPISLVISSIIRPERSRPTFCWEPSHFPDVALRSAGGNGASVNDTVCDEEMR